MLKKLRQGSLAMNTAWMTAGQGLRLVIQAVYFALIARSLGVVNYGAFVSVVALASILSPFSMLGGGNLLIKHIAQKSRSFSELWGAALTMTGLCGSGFLVLVVLLSHFVLPPAIPMRLVLLVATSDLIAQNIALMAGQAFQAYEKLHWTAGITVGISISRLLAMISLLMVQRHPNALQWGYAYFVSTVLIMGIALYCVSTQLGPPRFALYESMTDIREGFYFSASQSAQTIYNDIDKTMLAKLDTLAATGIYGAAYRIIDASFSPVSALLYAAYPGFFRAGKGGVRSAFAYGKPLLRRAFMYAALVSGALLLLAGLVPYVLGPEYVLTVVALRLLSPLPMLKATHYFLSDTLTGSGHQGLRSALQAGVAAFNVLINLWLIPAYSWRGAAWSSIASDFLLVCAVGTAVLVLWRKPVSIQEPVPLR